MPIDYKKYPPNWKTEIRPRILKRAENRCEFCGIKNYAVHWSAMMYKGSPRIKWFGTKWEAVESAKESGWNCPIEHPIVKPVKVVLTIAHLDHDETNWDVKDERLASLCQICHLKYDAKEKYNRRMI